MNKLRERTTATLLIAIFMISIFAVAIPVFAQPDEVWVDGVGIGTYYYETIQEGVDAVAVGGMVHVFAETYDEQVVIDKSLTLEGVGDTTIIQPSGAGVLTLVKTTPWIGTGTKQMAAIVFVDTAGEVTVRNLKIDGSLIVAVPTGVGGDWVAGLAYLETSGTIEGLTVTGNPTLGCRTAGIWASAIVETPVSVAVTGCTVIGYNRAGIYALGGELTADYNHNEINGPGAIISQVPNGMFFLRGAMGSATYNVITDLSYTGGTYRSTGIGTYNAGDDIVFSHNEISLVQNAFALSIGTSGTIVEYNDIHDCHTGVRIEAGASGSIIQKNDIYDNDFAIRCGPGMGDGNVAHYNNFVNNPGLEWTNVGEGCTYEGAVCNLYEETFDATLNWWGHASGPGGPYGRINKAENIIGKGDSVSPNVDWDPWLPQPVLHTPHDPVPPGLFE